MEVLRNKIIIILISIILLSILIVIGNNIRENKIVNQSEIIAENIIKLYRGDEGYKTLEIDDEIKGKIDNYNTELKSRDGLYHTINIAPSDDTYEEVSPEDAGAVYWEEDAYTDTEIAEEEIEVRIDTEGINKISETEYTIKINDLVFSSIGVSEVVIEGVPYNVYYQDVEETYQMIIKNPEYVYRYEKTINKGKKVEVFYSSAITKKLLCIEVVNNGFNIVDFNIK